MSEPRPPLEEIDRLLADADTVPVFVEREPAGLTPVSAMLALGMDAGSFLLESVEGPERVARWSLLGTAPVATLEAANGGDPLTAVQERVSSRRVAQVAGLDAPFTGGAIGFLTYEAAGRYERLPRAAGDPLQ